ncbi:MAG: ATP-dependent DNA helicase RecG [Pseudomonadales bacterium]
MTPVPSLPLTALKGVGPALAKTLERLSLTTIGDLLLHLPYRYEDRSQTVPLRHLEAGHAVLTEGEILRADITVGRRRTLRCVIADGTGTLTVRLFHFNRAQEATWRAGRWMRAFGEVRYGSEGLEMIHPDCRIHDERPPPPPPGLTPVYPTTRGLGQARLRSLAATVAGLDWPAPAGSPVPDLIRLHCPAPEDGVDALNATRERLALDELTAYHLVMRHRQSLRAHQTTRALPRGPQLGRALLNSLGFELTSAQRRVVREILEDLTQPTPMLRLLQGDVGSGKTVVAAFAAIRAAEHNAQTAVLAPTEILAEQHHASLSRWLDPLGISVVLLTGSLSSRRQREVTQAIAEGTALVAVGTHALVQSKVEFANLALCIVDEQHRFGVHQRMALRDKGLMPHQLVMTATPIPRTLTMAMYADMAISVIDELPRGRQPITTRIMPTSRREEVLRFLQQVLATGAQAYWVCPLIEEGEAPGLAAATTVAADLASELPKVTVGLLHGRLSAAEKAEVMSRFKSGEISLLVATTVVEVGVDVPNATLMVIENPERLGLAQLHQLRGRVGRGQRASTCLLFYSPPLGAIARSRLETIRETQDGFVIAERDLALRGPGEVLGTRQTGEVGFRIADLGKHAHLLPTALARADALLAAGDPAIQGLLSAWAPAERGPTTV